MTEDSERPDAVDESSVGLGTGAGTHPEAASQLELDALRVREALRESVHEGGPPIFPPWKKVLSLIVILGAILASVYLLVFPVERSSFVERVTALFVPPQEGRLFELPPPPPKAAEPKVQYEDTGRYSNEEYTGILYSSSNPVEMDQVEGEASDQEEPQFIPPPKTEGSEAAFQLLQKESAVAGRLVAGDVEGFVYKAWRPLKDAPPVFLIELIAEKEPDQEVVHLVWEVDSESQRIRPLSQAARDLERDSGGS